MQGYHEEAAEDDGDLEAAAAAAINGMINEGGGYDTQDGIPFVDTQSAPVDIEEEPLFDDDDTEPGTAKVGGHKRTGGYTALEDVCLCEAWMEIGQDPICGAQQKGGTFWRKVFNYFHEHKNLGDHPFDSDRSEASLQKRWALIQEQCTKFNNSYDQMRRKKQSGYGVEDLPTQAMGHFSVANKRKTFNLLHCWAALKDCQKWKELYNSLKPNGGQQAPTVIDDDGAAPAASASTGTASKRPRGRTSSKNDAKREASSQAVMESIKTLLADKSVSTEKRDERKRKEKEEAAKNYYDIQSKKLAIEEINVINKQKELELALLAEEAKIMSTPITDGMDPDERAWLEKKKKFILAREM